MRTTFIGTAIFIWVICWPAQVAGSTSGPSQLVTDWNEIVLQLAEAEDGFMTLKGVRTAAMMHIAIHDAIAAVHPAYRPYRYDGSDEMADIVAAANEAAFTVALNQYPDQADRLGDLRQRWAVTVASADAKARGLIIGKQAASIILEHRTNDGWDSPAEYSWHPMGPGVYAEFSDHSGTPEGFIFGAGWAKASGFALTSADQFRSAPPPAINSEAYTRAFDEVKRLGRFQSIQRTPDQTHLALWWKDFAESSHNRLARDLVQHQDPGLVETARLFALLNMSIFDAYVSAFDNKFFYNHWRPYTAIRWAANDGNSDTVAEESWTNTHLHTYAFPSYPSAHGTACAAAMSAIAAVFGDDYAFTMETAQVDLAGPFSGKIEMQPATRSFNSFSAAANECALSRVYLGIHFRYDSTEGFKLGQAVGNNVISRHLTPIDN